MQSNLTWMAAVADSDRGVRSSSPQNFPDLHLSQGLSVSLPVMHPPPSVEFVSMERIYQLYSTLPTIFANDIARRQNGMARRSQSPSVSLKRDRIDEHNAEIVNKRRDTGEHKLSSLPTSPSNHPPSSFATPSTASTPQPVTPSTSMGPPSHLPPNADPRRQMTAMRPPGQPQNSQPIVQPGAVQPNPTVVQPTNPSTNPLSANIPPQIAAMGAAAVQYYQMLQNPSNPMVQYITSSFPGFQSLPVAQQIMKMHQFQVLILLSFLPLSFFEVPDLFLAVRYFKEQGSSGTASPPTWRWCARQPSCCKPISNASNGDASSNPRYAATRGLIPSNIQ